MQTAYFLKRLGA